MQIGPRPQQNNMAYLARRNQDLHFSSLWDGNMKKLFIWNHTGHKTFHNSFTLLQQPPFLDTLHAFRVIHSKWSIWLSSLFCAKLNCVYFAQKSLFLVSTVKKTVCTDRSVAIILLTQSLHFVKRKKIMLTEMVAHTGGLAYISTHLTKLILQMTYQTVQQV